MIQTPTVLKTRLGLLHMAKHLRNMSETCWVIGYSRHNSYRFKERPKVAISVG